jgi:3-hydroxybutyryl-CoA dehydrogenase
VAEDPAGTEQPELVLGVVGGGTMGAGIAYAAARAGLSVQVVERDPTTRDSLLSRIEGDLRRDVVRGLIEEEELEATSARVRPLGASEELEGPPDLVIEAVPEEAELKASVLRGLEGLGVARLATNTSSISVSGLGAALEHPERLIGLHFFNPVRQMALVEIVLGEATAPALLEFSRAFVLRLGKEPLVVADAPGFLTSRLGVLLGLEAIRMHESGVASAEEIDKAMVLGYGHPMGPLRLTDLVGLDVRLGIAGVLEAAYGERFRAPALLIEMVREGRLGRKVGRGFYEWPALPTGGRAEGA